MTLCIKCLYAECRDCLHVMLSVAMLNVNMLNVAMLIFGSISAVRQTDETGSVFTTLHFLRKLWMYPISCRVTLRKAGESYRGQTLQLTEPILKLQRKWSVVNITPNTYHNIDLLQSEYHFQLQKREFIVSMAWLGRLRQTIS
jgi:hypothetical protein